MHDVRRAAIDDALDTEVAMYTARTSRSFERLSSYSTHLPLGVATSFQSHYPYPLMIRSGEGAHVIDADDNVYVDLHAGFGASICGHAHPALVEAVAAQARSGTHFGYPGPELGELAQLMADRFNLEQLRFSLSGTEAVMDALRIARAHTGREIVLRCEGAYHGHSPEGLVSVKPHPDAAGHRAAPRPVAASEGLPSRTTERVRVVPFNDVAALRAMLEREGSQIAAFILEPVMCNLGMVLPENDYLRLAVQLCAEHGVLCIFDEVKTALTVDYAGAAERYDCQPDLRVLGKAIGGGLPLAAFGGRAELLAVVRDGRAPHYGTFGGWPLAVRTALVAMRDVLSRPAWEAAAKATDRLTASAQRSTSSHGLTWHTVALGLKGGLFAAAERLRDYRDYTQRLDRSLAQLQWTFFANRGVLIAPGADEQWTLSVAFRDHHVDQAAAVIDQWVELCAALPPD